MRKKQRTRWIALAMAAVMAASVLAGCGGNGDGGTDKGNTQTAAGAAAGAGGAGASEQAASGNGGTEEPKTSAPYPATFEPFGSNAETYTQNMETFQQEFLDYFEETGQMDKVRGYDEPIDVTMVRYYSSGLQALIDSYKSQYGESYEENRFTDIIKRLLNVDIIFNWTTGESQYTQKLRLDMAANELPDIFFVTNMDDLAGLAEEGLIWELDDLIDQYASDDLKGVIESQSYALQKGRIDGRLYGLAATMAMDNARYIYIREDWMENLGLEYPKTLDELAAVVEAFATQDPDGNGIDDTYGLSGLSDYTYCFGAIFQGFGSYPTSLHEVERGKNVFGGTTEETKEAVAYLTDLYQKGYIQKDFASQSTAQEKELITQGKVGIVMGNHSLAANMFNSLHELDPSVTWRAIPAPTKTGEPNKLLLSPNIKGFIAVNKEFEHPEIAIKMADIIASAVYNSSVGDWWYYDSNSSYALSPVYVFMPALSNLETYRELQEAFKTNDTSALSAKGLSYWKLMHGDNEAVAWAYNAMFGEGEGTPMAVLDSYFRDGNYFYETFNGQYSEQMNKTYSSIKSTMNQIFLSIITGQQDLETGWDQWIETFGKLKGDEILDYVNEWCAENNSFN